MIGLYPQKVKISTKRLPLVKARELAKTASQANPKAYWYILRDEQGWYCVSPSYLPLEDGFELKEIHKNGQDLELPF